MPRDNNITNSQEQNATTNQEAESLHNNIPGDNTGEDPLKEASEPKEGSKKVTPPLSKESVPNQANTGEPE